MKIECRKSQIHGNGIFAVKNIEKNEIIEECPIIILNSDDTIKIDPTNLYNYYFSWENNWSAIALGYGSIYNHSYEPNAVYEKDFINNKIIFRALKNLYTWEEILVNYNWNPNKKEKVWFDKD